MLSTLSPRHGAAVRGPGGALFRARPVQRQRRCLAAPGAVESVDRELQKRVLKDYLKAVGVADRQQRQNLAERFLAHTEAGRLPDVLVLQPGQESEIIRRNMRQVLQLHMVLGSREDIDVVWMVVKEPRLLDADPSILMQRLLHMRALAGSISAVVEAVEAQPRLLLCDNSDEDDETGADKLRAWRFGLVSDGTLEWTRRLANLQAYIAEFGDAHVGNRQNDSPELTRWAKKQRADYHGGHLPHQRYNVLTGMDFDFDEENAEWMVAYKAVSARHLDQSGDPCRGVGAEDFYLTNWCSVQRIAKRSRVLSTERVALLDSIDFDWTGADALS